MNYVKNNRPSMKCLVRRNDEQNGKLEIGRSTVDLRLPSVEHFVALENALNKMIRERFLSDAVVKEREICLDRFRQLIEEKKKIAFQMEICGSFLFSCALEKASIVDLDVQFESNDCLKELLQILEENVEFCHEIRFNVDHQRKSIDFRLVENSSCRFRMTSADEHRILLSKLIFLYTQFDSRLLELIRIFRYLTKICNIDQIALGTFHPVVFHLMVIFFLQQLDPPVLPVLHEHIFGLDRIPVKVDDKNSEEFFRRAAEFSLQWKSLNRTSVSLLFLQCLSFYIRTFDYQKCLISIQSRMPIVKTNRKFFVQDPIDVDRNLCSTMESTRSWIYFRQVFTAALNYFGRKQKKTTTFSSNDESIEIPLIDSNDSLHRSYRILSQRFPPKFFDQTQNQIREIYENLPELDDFRPSTEIFPDSNSTGEFFYDFQPENFHAEQGAPIVCLICNGIGHLKSECPELNLPKLIDLPSINSQWFNVLSSLCQRITDRFRPTPTDICNRKEILNQLEKIFHEDFPSCELRAFGSFYNGFAFCQSDLDVSLVFPDQRHENSEEIFSILKKLFESLRSNSSIFDNVQSIFNAKVPIIRSRHRRFQIDIDISLDNFLAIENTRLLKMYTEIDRRVSQLGYMIKHLAKTCEIGDASRGTLSSYAYILMLIHFLQQTQPAVLPVLQQLNDDENKSSHRPCLHWNVYFFDDLTKLKNVLWKGENRLSSGELWIEFLRFYTEKFRVDSHVVTIRQKEILLKDEKHWQSPTIAIEDPFELTHNLAANLSMKNWMNIRRVFIRARQQFAVQPKKINLEFLESRLFNVEDFSPGHLSLRRCEDCKGPYHIRKRCPQLLNEREEQFDWSPRRSFVPYSSRIWFEPYSDSQRSSMRYFNSQRKQCFQCGSFDHLKAQCDQLRINLVQR